MSEATFPDVVAQMLFQPQNVHIILGPPWNVC